MTNALRKAPQHTAVGFKQTVSSSPLPPRHMLLRSHLSPRSLHGVPRGASFILIQKVASDVSTQRCLELRKRATPCACGGWRSDPGR